MPYYIRDPKRDHNFDNNPADVQDNEGNHRPKLERAGAILSLYRYYIIWKPRYLAIFRYDHTPLYSKCHILLVLALHDTKTLIATLVERFKQNPFSQFGPLQKPFLLPAAMSAEELRAEIETTRREESL